MSDYKRMVVIDKGELFFIQNAAGESVSFESRADFERCTGLDFSGKFRVNYEPEKGLFIDSRDASVDNSMIPFALYEDLIGLIPTLSARKADPFYGLSGAERTAKILEVNKEKAEAEVEVLLETLRKNDQRKAAGLPPTLNAASEEALKEHVLLVQSEADNPSEDEAYNPPLPPGVTAPAVKSLSVIIQREEGWQGALGFRATLKASSEDYVPTNLALAVYSGDNCTGYLYTTGTFQQDAETGEYFAVCPPGQEPGDAAVHMGLLYGAAQLSCFTLGEGVQERVVYAYEEI